MQSQHQLTENQNNSQLNSEIITVTEASKTKSLSFNSHIKQRRDECIEDLIKSLSSEIPHLNFLNEYSPMFSLSNVSCYLISTGDQMKINRYKENQLGGGGYGQVFLCTNLKTYELHAIKVINQVSFHNMIDILTECINQYYLAQQSKELILNIVDMIHIKIINSQAHFQIPLELAEFSLYEYIQNNEINEKIYQQLTNTLIDFLILLHENNYAHRDIKPQNILYVKDKGWKLADFGESFKYDISKGLYKIQGTLAFLPQEVRMHRKQNIEILQDLFKNDIYATVCTLVMIKNPKFKSLELIKHMDQNDLDPVCTKLLNITKFEELKSLKFENIEKFQYYGNIIQRNHEIVQYDIRTIIYHFGIQQIVLDKQIIQFIDNQLEMLYSNNQITQYKFITFQLISSFPFQIQSFKNIKFTYDMRLILKQPSLYFQDSVFKYKFYFERGFHKYLLDNFYKLSQKDTFGAIQTRLILAMMYEELEEAKGLLSDLANKYYSETSQVNSDFIMFYNYIYQRLYSQYPIFYSKNQYMINENMRFQNLEDFSKKNLKDEDIEDYLNIQSFQVGGRFHLRALFHPLSRNFIRLRSQKIFEHILEHLGCSVEQIMKDRSKLSQILKQKLQIIIDTRSFSLQLIIYGCIALYLNYDLIFELLDFLIYIQEIQTMLMYQKERFETTIEIQRISIKYNINIDLKFCNLHNLKVVVDLKSRYFIVTYLLQQYIYLLQIKIIKENFKSDIQKFRLFHLGLLRALKLIQKYYKDQIYFCILQEHLWKCIFQSKLKYQKRFLQAIILFYQNQRSNQLFMKHLNNLKQYKRVINSATREDILPSTQRKSLLIKKSEIINFFLNNQKLNLKQGLNTSTPLNLVKSSQLPSICLIQYQLGLKLKEIVFLGYLIKQQQSNQIIKIQS